MSVAAVDAPSSVEEFLRKLVRTSLADAATDDASGAGLPPAEFADLDARDLDASDVDSPPLDVPGLDAIRPSTGLYRGAAAVTDPRETLRSVVALLAAVEGDALWGVDGHRSFQASLRRRAHVAAACSRA